MDGTFTIIIPTCNSAETIQRCLDSIINQDYQHYKILIIDNLSTDTTIDIITQYSEKYNSINYVSEKDKGIYDAMNKGINTADGDWIYFLGSDDTLYDNQVLSKVAFKSTKTDAQVIYGNVVMRGKNQWNLDNVVFDGEYDLGKLIDRNICHQAIFYNKSVFEKNGHFNLKYITSADFDFNMRCFANTKFSFIDAIIANFFVGGHSTNIEDLAFYKDRGALLYKYFGSRIFSKNFLNARLYIQQAALASFSPLNVLQRVYCLLAYLKLKSMALLS